MKVTHTSAISNGGGHQHELWGRQSAVLQSLTGQVAGSLHLLTSLQTKHWWAGELFEFMQQPDYHRDLSQMREESRALSDDLLVALVGDMVTEEALPNYSARLAVMLPDPTGVADDPWSVWQRGWSAEEDQHGAALHQYLLLTGRVDMSAVSRSIYSLIRNGFRQEPSLYQGIFYPMFQEPATQLSHGNVAKLAFRKGVRACAEICGKIAGDESRHAQFYLEVARAVFKADPEQAVQDYATLIRQRITMPAELIDDGRRGAPDLFNDFATITARLGIYTAFDYADILERLNGDLNIGALPLNGTSAKAQEYLCCLPTRIRRAAERSKPSTSDASSFAWIHGRSV